MQEKINSIIDIAGDNAIPILIITVAFGSFGLGRLSVSNISYTDNEKIIHVEEFKQPTKVSDVKVADTVINTGNLVASVNGTKYHYPWCSGAQRINEENKLWFDSADDARASGYTPAANCKGLD